MDHPPQPLTLSTKALQGCDWFITKNFDKILSETIEKTLKGHAANFQSIKAFSKELQSSLNNQVCTEATRLRQQALEHREQKRNYKAKDLSKLQKKVEATMASLWSFREPYKPVDFQSEEWWAIMKKLQKGFRSIIIFDLETTGLSKQFDCVTQLGWIKIDASNRSIIKNSSTVKPLFKNHADNWVQKPLHQMAAELTKLSDDQLTDLPTLDTYLPEFIRNVNNEALIIGYNSNEFDLAIWFKEIQRIKDRTNNPSFPDLREEVVSLDIAQWIWSNHYKTTIRKDNSKWRLETSYKKFMQKDMQNAHDALADCTAVMELLPSAIKLCNIPRGKAKMNMYMNNHFSTKLAQLGIIWFSQVTG